jgi:glc operon protein GlcG
MMICTSLSTRFRTGPMFLSMLVALGLWNAHARAQTAAPPYGPAITQAVAEKIAAAAVGEARQKNWRLAIAVVDPHGFLVHFVRMDDTQTSGPAIAVEKARTAAMFRRPSRVFEDGLAKRPAYLGLPGATPVIGGVPIIVDGKVIGGIGASGAASDDDELAVLAGLRALAK